MKYGLSADVDVVFDIESNGLLEEVTKLWVICCIDVVSEKVLLFHDFPQFNLNRIKDTVTGDIREIPKRDGTFSDGVAFLKAGRGKRICHNVLGYDHFLLKKFYPKYKIDNKRYHDTLLQSQLQWFDRPPVKGYQGVHGLDPWGARVGIGKPPINDWKTIDAFKIDRCIEDVKINLLTHRWLEKELTTLEGRIGFKGKKILSVESEYRFNSTKQELSGALVDKPLMESCVKELDILLEDLRSKLEPQLPVVIKRKGESVAGYHLFIDLGIKNPPPLEYNYKDNGDGTTKRTEKKLYYQPVKKFTNKVKYRDYSVYTKEGLQVKSGFRKIKEARDWVKEHLPDQKGFKYPFQELSRSVYTAYTSEYWGLDQEDYAEGAGLVGGIYTRVEFPPTKMTQHAIVKKFLLSLGWRPTEYNYKKDSKGKFVRNKGKLIETSPKLTEDSYHTLPEGVGKSIADYNTYQHRRRYLKNEKDNTKGLLNHIRSDGRVGCGIVTFGTSTGRGVQKTVVNLPSPQALYGDKMRRIIVAPKGKKLVGCDMSGAQLRLAADFTNNREYAEALVRGNETEEFSIVDHKGNYFKKDEERGVVEVYTGADAHTINCIGFKLATEEQKDLTIKTQESSLIKAMGLARKIGKNGTYATIFGAAGKKLGAMLGCPEEEGDERKNAFLAKLGLDKLIEELLQEWKRNFSKKRGGCYIETLGGFQVYCGSQHKLLNYKIQGAEAVIQRFAVNYVHRELRKRRMKSFQILNVHDEYLFESPEEEAEEMGSLASEAYKWAAKELGLWIEFGGDSKIGNNYYDVH